MTVKFIDGQRTSIVVLVNPTNILISRRQPGVVNDTGDFLSPMQNLQFDRDDAGYNQSLLTVQAWLKEAMGKE